VTQTVVVTIHGTFAPRATWVDPCSPVARRVRDTIGGDCRIVPLRWTGANRFSDRLDAAAALIELLESQPDDVPCLIIAHSHGGSIVHYAYRQNPRAFARVQGVACLATPFFGFAVRPGYASLVMAMAVGALTLCYEAALSAVLVVARRLDHRLFDDVTPVATLGSVTLFSLVLTTVWMYRRRQRLYARLGRIAEGIMAWDTTSIAVPRVCIFRSIGDEVALGLSAGQFATMLTTRVLNAAARLTASMVYRLASWWQTRIGRVLLPAGAVAVAVIASLPVAFATTFGTAPRYWIDLLWAWNSSFDCWSCSSRALDVVLRLSYELLVILVSVSLLGAAGFLLVLVGGWALSVVILRLFGTWSLLGALVLQCAVEPTPEGAHRFVNTGWLRDVRALEQDQAGLQHSDPYSSPIALAALSEWVTAVLLREQATP
jgi:hypothetical protein